MKFSFVFLNIMLFLSFNFYGQDSSLSYLVEITGIDNTKGHIGVAVFEGEQGFPMDIEKAKTIDFVPIQDTVVYYKIQSLPRGEYAITVFHDEDLNREVETNFIGMPKEGVGVSSNPKPRMGAPQYEDCKFHTDTIHDLRIRMKYIGR